jgi:hypothetical protein
MLRGSIQSFTATFKPHQVRDAALIFWSRLELNNHNKTVWLFVRNKQAKE